jgi:hypothetical protein
VLTLQQLDVQIQGSEVKKLPPLLTHPAQRDLIMIRIEKNEGKKKSGRNKIK